MLTPSLILLMMGGLLAWGRIKVGQTESISELFYHDDTKKVFKAVLWLCGAVLIYHDLGNSVLTTAGLALIGVPIFGDFYDPIIRWFHFSLAMAFFILTSLYLGGAWPWIMLAGGVIGVIFIKENKIYWLEIAGVLTLIIGFYAT